MTQSAEGKIDPDNDEPCAGIVVLDLSQLLSGPHATQALADLGAEVIRVEVAGSDALRQQPPVHNGIGAFFEQANRGKKSVEIDIKSAAGRDMVRELVKQCDVFVQNSRPGVMERLGLGYEDLKPLNPGLIYYSVSGFGEDNPLSGKTAYDQVIQGITGFMPIQGSPEKPEIINNVAADKITGMWGANAILAALLRRERNGGRGQKVHVNMVSAYSAFLLVDLMHNYTFDAPGLPTFVQPPKVPPIQTRDGFVIGYVLHPKQAARLCEVLGLPELAADPRFASTPLMVKNINQLFEAIAPRVRQMDTAAFLALMEAESLPFGPVNTVAEFVESDEARYTDTFSFVDDPEYGRIRHVSYPGRFDDVPVAVKRRAPRLGEHTAEILARIGK